MARLSTKSSGKLSRVKRSDNGKIYNKVDPVLVAAVVGLMAFGVLMVYSASSYNARVNYGNEYYYMFKQLIGVVLGLVAMTACAITDYHILKKWRFVILAVSFAMLVAVLIAFVGIFGITALWIMPVALVSGVLSSMLFSLLDRWLIGRGLLPGK